MDPYHTVLQKIALLRARGLKDSHPEMMRVRTKLRDILEDRKKHRKPGKALLPKLVGSTTITLDEVKKPSKSKYAILGAAVGIAGVAYLLYKKKFG